MRKNVLVRAVAALLGAAAIAALAPATSASAEDAVDQLASGAKLMPGQSMKSGDSVLTMQGDGNLVLSLRNPATGARGPVLWSTGTWGNWNAYAYMQPDGNLVIYRQGSTAPSDALWSTGTWGTWGGNLTLYRGSLQLWTTVSGGGKGWWSHTGLAPAIGFGGAYPEAFITRARNIESGQWIQSNSAWLVNQPDGNLVLYRKRDGAAMWSSGTWNKPPAMLILTDNPSYPALELMEYNGRVNWSTPAKGQPGNYGIVQDDGNFVIYSNGTALWSTRTWGNW